MLTNRLQLALELIKPTDWKIFEKLSSSFLASEFENLRTTASLSGDAGRDAELFLVDNEPNIMLQYSLQKEWEQKIKSSAKQINENFPNTTFLIYVSNQEIGALGDNIKNFLRKKYCLTLDIRDRNWFIERCATDKTRQNASEEFSQIIVDPYLSSKGIKSHVPSELSSPEAVAAVTLLGLQWQDDVREKGLTKLAFEALVHSVLSNTDTNNRIPRNTIHSTIYQLLPDHAHNDVKILIDAALKRLTKKSIKHWQKEDEFCLSHEEKLKLIDYEAKLALLEASLIKAIEEICDQVLLSYNITKYKNEFIICLRKTTESVMFNRSQTFAMEVKKGSLVTLADSDFQSIIFSQILSSNLPKIPNIDWTQPIRRGVRSILLSNNPTIQTYMRSKADAYTLMAFLRQTPDVQSAVNKMFSDGEIWLDTTIILPLIAETLDNNSLPGHFTRMISAANKIGLELFVTDGVIEETERHMNRSLRCARSLNNNWSGQFPYLFDRFIQHGNSTSSFASWLDNFRGESRPEQDISEYLKDKFNIKTLNLEFDSNDEKISEIRNALQLIWRERYKKRQERYGVVIDDTTIDKLVSHDIECYCGVILRRNNRKTSPFGYSAWWLTVDKHTFNLKDKLSKSIKGNPPDSPVISADFMVNYLVFCPNRNKIDKSQESHLPLLMHLGDSGNYTAEILATADKIREELKGKDELIIKRNIRDYLDRAKGHIGPIANAGMDDDIDYLFEY
ncbi:MAG: hypothetical protein HQL96_07385 [Magnetococcales bacterium]|nr:hypothetical protein [Magnetococcales bacterium]